MPRLLSSTTSLATWKFCYSEEHNNGLPDSVILSGPVVAKLGYWDLKSLQCKLGYDHLGTVKLIADQYNDLVKELIYDSFGNVISETEQRIYFPLGFAGGLRDIATGFVCFGFRDYDPSVGRFTTPDPALDIRGDGDIYDYCVDDPVNFVDPTGLWTAETFEEYKVLRDAGGRFTNGSSSGVTPRKNESSGFMFFKPYDAPGKREWIEGLQQALKPGLEAWGKGILTFDAITPNVKKEVIEWIIDLIFQPDSKK